MRISVLLYCFCILAGCVAALGVLFLVLNYWEKTDSVVKKILLGFAGAAATLGIFYVASMPFFHSSQVIEVNANGWHKESDWLFAYRHKGEAYPIHSGKWYVFNEDEEIINLVLTPVYYHIDPDSVGLKVPHLAEPDTLQGRFFELPHNPVFLFQPPDTVSDTYVDCREIVLYHLGVAGSGQIIPDTYQRLEFKAADYYSE